MCIQIRKSIIVVHCSCTMRTDVRKWSCFEFWCTCCLVGNCSKFVWCFSNLTSLCKDYSITASGWRLCLQESCDICFGQPAKKTTLFSPFVAATCPNPSNACIWEVMFYLLVPSWAAQQWAMRLFDFGSRSTYGPEALKLACRFNFGSLAGPCWTSTQWKIPTNNPAKNFKAWDNPIWL